MKRAVNLRLDESIILTLNQLTEELHSTKTEVIENAIKLFSKHKQLKQSELLEFAGTLKCRDADVMIADIADNKDSKSFDLDLS
jgi:hypothetical protein